MVMEIDLSQHLKTLWQVSKKTYGEESYRVDELQEGSIWGDPDDFMYALQHGDRNLYAMWSKEFDIITELLKDPVISKKIDSATNEERQKLVFDKAAEYQKLPSDISVIGVFTNVLSTSSRICLFGIRFFKRKRRKGKSRHGILVG
jgi:hypothetical protein